MAGAGRGAPLIRGRSGFPQEGRAPLRSAAEDDGPFGLGYCRIRAPRTTALSHDGVVVTLKDFENIVERRLAAEAENRIRDIQAVSNLVQKEGEMRGRADHELRRTLAAEMARLRDAPTSPRIHSGCQYYKLPPDAEAGPSLQQPCAPQQLRQLQEMEERTKLDVDDWRGEDSTTSWTPMADDAKTDVEDWRLRKRKLSTLSSEVTACQAKLGVLSDALNAAASERRVAFEDLRAEVSASAAMLRADMDEIRTRMRDLSAQRIDYHPAPSDRTAEPDAERDEELGLLLLQEIREEKQDLQRARAEFIHLWQRQAQSQPRAGCGSALGSSFSGTIGMSSPPLGMASVSPPDEASSAALRKSAIEHWKNGFIAVWGPESDWPREEGSPDSSPNVPQGPPQLFATSLLK